MSDAYTLEVKNQSGKPLDFTVFQQPPQASPGNVFSLAWFTDLAEPDAVSTFSWSIDYQFVWAHTGELKPGVPFAAKEALDASPTGQNTVALDTDPNTGLAFKDLGAGARPGSLVMRSLNATPSRVAAMGLNMKVKDAGGKAGSAIYAVQAEPNMDVEFAPHANYRICAARCTPGEVLDPDAIADAAEIAFPVGVTRMLATYEADGSWTVAPA